ncbi:MAG TPA: YIP1 family protein, partial [Cytophagaceae bacterium]
SIIYKIVDSLLVFGAIWVFLFYLYPYALYRIGRTSEGQEDFKTLRTIVSLSTIPTIIELLFVIIAIFTGNSLDFENHHPLLSGIIALFSFNILVIGTSMVQRFPLNQSMIYAGLPVFFIIVIYMIFSY